MLRNRTRESSRGYRRRQGKARAKAERAAQPPAAGPVTVTQAQRCTACGGWVRPGVDHTCEATG